MPGPPGDGSRRDDLGMAERDTVCLPSMMSVTSDTGADSEAGFTSDAAGGLPRPSMAKHTSSNGATVEPGVGNPGAPSDVAPTHWSYFYSNPASTGLRLVVLEKKG